MTNPQYAGQVFHVYLSTGCLHGRHDYCNSMTGFQGQKRPGRCKFCDAPCICGCHGSKDAMDIEQDARLTPEALGRAAYASYGEKVAHRNFRGDPLPEWDGLGTLIQDAWIATAGVIFSAGFREGFRAGATADTP